MPPTPEERIAVLENQCVNFEKTMGGFTTALKEFNESLTEFNKAIERLKTLYDNPTAAHCVFKDDITKLKEFMVAVKTGGRIAYVLVFGGGVVNLGVLVYALILLGKIMKEGH